MHCQEVSKRTQVVLDELSKLGENDSEDASLTEIGATKSEASLLSVAMQEVAVADSMASWVVDAGESVATVLKDLDSRSEASSFRECVQACNEQLDKGEALTPEANAKLNEFHMKATKGKSFQDLRS